LVCNSSAGSSSFASLAYAVPSAIAKVVTVIIATNTLVTRGTAVTRMSSSALRAALDRNESIPALS
jgi:hypothetical protein